MSQAALLFEANALPAADGTTHAAPARRRFEPAHYSELDHIGFEIGRDHARYLLTPPLAHLHADNPVRQGWTAGRLVFGSRTLRATPQTPAWLHLRLDAWQRGNAFEDLQVTPAYLARLHTETCPVTRQPLEGVIPAAAPSARAAKADSGSGITRLNRQAAYAAGNLTVLSSAAQRALGQRSAAEAMALARQIEDTRCDPVDGLDATQWTRLAVLVSFATPLPHAQAAALPLRVLPPARLHVLNPVQALQVMLTLQFTEGGYARRLVTLAALMPDCDTRQAFQVFMHTLLARRLAAGDLRDEAAVRQALEDTWADPLVLRRWQRLALRLTPAQCEQLLQAAERRGLAGRNARWLPLTRATEGWALDRRGLVAGKLAPEAQPFKAH